jgi:hypothetical protein
VGNRNGQAMHAKGGALLPTFVPKNSLVVALDDVRLQFASRKLDRSLLP